MEATIKIRKQIKDVQQDIAVLYRASRDSRTPWLARCLIFIILAYLLSPIDLIPDFIPVIGMLDEVLLLPVLASIALNMVPEEIKK